MSTPSDPHAVLPDPPRQERAPEVSVRLGALPPPAPYPVVFVANLLGLFFGNEAKTRMLAEEVGEIDSYGGRLLPVVDLLFRPPEESTRNLLVLERAPDPALTAYLEGQLGLSLPDCTVLPHEAYTELGRRLAEGGDLRHPLVDRITAHPGRHIDGYVTDPTLVALARRTGKLTCSSAEGSRQGNDKVLLHRFLERAGLPLLPTELARDPADLERCLASLSREGFRSAVVRSSIGASGIGMVRLDGIGDDPAGPIPVPDHFFDEGPCLVQGWLSPGDRGLRRVRSPSIQLLLAEHRITLYDLTDQILSDASVHEGNEAPPPWIARQPAVVEELVRQATESARWLHARGYRGPASVDFLVAEGTSTGEGRGGPGVYVCEINARVTGATYPSLLARHLFPGGTWLMQNLRFSHPLSGADVLERLDRNGHLFERDGSRPGILPINLNFDPEGRVTKGQFLCLSPTARGSELLLLMAELELPCAPDRD